MNNNIEFDAILPAVRIGFARAMSERGYTPEQFETKLASLMSKEAGVLDVLKSMISTAMGAGKMYTYGVIGGGALLGGLSGIARSSMEQHIDGKDDPQVSGLSAKADSYEKMVQEMKDNQSATAPVLQQQKRPQEAMR
jgi:hypothetical protein